MRISDVTHREKNKLTQSGARDDYSHQVAGEGNMAVLNLSDIYVFKKSHTYSNFECVKRLTCHFYGVQGPSYSGLGSPRHWREESLRETIDQEPN